MPITNGARHKTSLFLSHQIPFPQPCIFIYKKYSTDL